MHYEDDELTKKENPDQIRKKIDSILKNLQESGNNPLPIPRTKSKNISHSFWGKQWCRFISEYEDYSHRLQQGRSSLRAGRIVDLKIKSNHVNSLVYGSEIYRVAIKFSPILKNNSEKLYKVLSSKITSLIDFLTGKIPEDLIHYICDPTHGVFPKNHEILAQCNCLDYASICKHSAAVLYGIGVRFDEDPSLFFKLRNIDINDIQVATGNKYSQNIETKIDTKITEQLFGIQIDKNSIK